MFEIIENPKIIVDKAIDSNQVQVNGLRLGDDYQRIRLEDVDYVHVQDYDYSNDNFTKRLEQLKKHDGNVNIVGGLCFFIKNKKVAAIRLQENYVDRLRSYDHKKIIKVYGEPDRVLRDSRTWVTEYAYAMVLAYSKRRLYFFLDPNTKRPKEIHIGDLDERRYAEW